MSMLISPIHTGKLKNFLSSIDTIAEINVLVMNLSNGFSTSLKFGIVRIWCHFVSKPTANSAYASYIAIPVSVHRTLQPIFLANWSHIFQNQLSFQQNILNIYILRLLNWFQCFERFHEPLHIFPSSLHVLDAFG